MRRFVSRLACLLLAGVVLPAVPLAAQGDPLAPLRIEMGRLAQAQQGHRATTGRYASSIAELAAAGYQPSATVTASLLLGGAEGWSAMVMPAGAETGVRCIGTHRHLEGAAGVVCQGAALAAAPVAAPAAAAPDAPPQVKSCEETESVSGLSPGFVLVRFVVGPTGVVSPADMRVLQSPSIKNSIWAIAAIANCVYEPARRNGEPVEAVVTRRVLYSAPAPSAPNR